MFRKVKFNLIRIMDTNQLTASNIKNARKNKQISQREFAKLLDLSPAAVNRIENGMVEISIVTLEKISKVLEVEFTELLNLKSGNQTYNLRDINALQQGSNHTLVLNLDKENFDSLTEFFSKKKEEYKE